MAERLKIALVTDCYLPRRAGIELQVHDLALHLASTGHNVEVVTPTRGAAEVDGIRVHRLGGAVPLPWNTPVTRGPFRQVRQILATEDYDVVHCHSGTISPISYWAAYQAQKHHIPTVMTSHSVWGSAHILARLADRCVSWSDWNVLFSGVSRTSVADITTHVSTNTQVHVLPNGVDGDIWRVTPALKKARTVTLASVMRLHTRKRPRPLIHMVRQVRDRVPAEITLRVVIIGDGPEREPTARLIARYGLGDTVKLAGVQSREQIRTQFASTDVFVAPANLESFGLAALEARAAGLPIVAKVQTGIADYIEHGRHGLLAHTDEEMVDHLVSLITNVELREKIALTNRETPHPYDWAEVVECNLALYQHAVSANGHRARPPLGPAMK